MSKKQIYLSIDDSPTDSFPHHVELLLRHNIHAVFFCIGSQMHSYWEELKYAINKGFIIANHSYTHPHFSDIDLSTAKEEIKNTDELLDQLYKDCDIKQYNKYFRFPYGDKGDGKYGRHFFSFEDARKKRGSFFQKFKRGVLMLSPMNRHLEEEKKKSMTLKARAIQKYLYELGYVGADALQIEYDFFKHLCYDRDWSWTFDIKEWEFGKQKNTNSIMNLVNQRLDQKHPSDPRTSEKYMIDLDDIAYKELVLFHDRKETNHIFNEVIESLLKRNFDFLQIPN